MLTEEDLIKNGKELPGCTVSLKINYYVIQFLPHTKCSLFPLDRPTRKSCLIQLIFVHSCRCMKNINILTLWHTCNY